MSEIGPVPAVRRWIVLELDRLQRHADRTGRRCVVGGVVADAQQQVLMLRRSPHARLFPGAWDIVGGHVEPGESLLDALAREITEETGWSLAGVDRMLRVFDWKGADGVERLEVDLLVSVHGDLAQPRIEQDAFSEAQWYDRSALRVLSDRFPENDMIQVALAGLDRWVMRPAARPAHHPQ